MVPKRRPGRPPKNPPMQTFPSYGGNKVASPPLPPGSIIERAAAVPKAAGSKAERQPKEESESEAADESGRSSHKKARTEEKTEDEQSPNALSTRMQL